MERIGIILCNCGGNIGNTVDLKELERRCRESGVYSFVGYNDMLCNRQGVAYFKEQVQAHKLDKIVLAACSPKQHETTFMNACGEIQFNPYCMYMVNIREQCAWVHKDKAVATEKAALLIEMGTARIQHHVPLVKKSIDFNTDVLVLGSGPAGIEAALLLAESGRKVHLVEREPFIGGILSRLNQVYPAIECAPCLLSPKLQKVLDHKNIVLHTLATVQQLKGFLGNFEISIQQSPRYINDECIGCAECIAPCPVHTQNKYNENLVDRKAIYFPYAGALPNLPLIDPDLCIRFKGQECDACAQACPFEAVDFKQQQSTVHVVVGAVVLATGFDIVSPPERSPERNIFSAMDFERLSSEAGPTSGSIMSDKKPGSVAIVMPDRSNLSVMNASKYVHYFKEKYPETAVYVFNPQNAFLECEGIEIIEYEPREIISKESTVVLTYHDALENSYEVQADMVILGAAGAPTSTIKQLSQMLLIDLSENGFIKEHHECTSPVATNIDGIFAIGGIRGPAEATVRNCLMQAHAACGNILSRYPAGRKIDIEPLIAEIKEELCSGCGICFSVCPYTAIEKKDKKYVAHDILCRGCGICISACPSLSGGLHYFSDEAVLAEIESALRTKRFQPTILTFLCNWCSYLAADSAGSRRLEYPPGVLPIRLPCSGRVDPAWILEGFRMGADYVAVFGCHPGDCHYRDGNIHAMKRIALLKRTLSMLGIEPDRLLLNFASATEGERFAHLFDGVKARHLTLP